MVNMLNCRNWILSPLLSIGFLLIFFNYAAHAALLKDIRVGEYEKFTRIVFELDSPTEPQTVDLISSDRLSVVFANTSAAFIRKIPVERSRHIKNIQIWEKSNQLSALLIFDFEHFRHESFRLNNPPRIVLDIQPLENTPEVNATAAPAGPITNGGSPPAVEESKIPGAFSIREQAPPLPVNDINRDRTSAEPNSSPSLKTSPADTPAIPETRTSDLGSVGNKTDSPQITATVAGHPKLAKRSSRLQFYLVVMLVLITIVILILLLLMLLSRHRWADDNKQLRPREFLTNQDKHIASLDARIKEQLKRYEEV